VLFRVVCTLLVIVSGRDGWGGGEMAGCLCVVWGVLLVSGGGGGVGGGGGWDGGFWGGGGSVKMNR